MREEGVVAIGVTGVNHVFCAGPTSRRSRASATSRTAAPSGPSATASCAGSPTPPSRRSRSSTASPSAAGWRRPCTARTGRSPAPCAASGCPRRTSGSCPAGAGRTCSPAWPSGRRGQGRDRERAREQQDALRPAGLPGRHRRRAVRAGRLPRAVAALGRDGPGGRDQRGPRRTADEATWSAAVARGRAVADARSTVRPRRRTGRSTSSRPRARTTGTPTSRPRTRPSPTSGSPPSSRRACTRSTSCSATAASRPVRRRWTRAR